MILSLTDAIKLYTKADMYANPYKNVLSELKIQYTHINCKSIILNYPLSYLHHKHNPHPSNQFILSNFGTQNFPVPVLQYPHTMYALRLHPICAQEFC